MIRKEGKFSKNKKSGQSRTVVIADAVRIGVHLLRSEVLAKNRISKRIINLKKNRMQRILENRKEDLKNICQALKIKRLYAFGSVVSDKFTVNSDIDFLISFTDTLTIEEYTNNYFLLHYRLRELFNREIDIVTERTLSNPYFIESINETKELIDEA
ncbi:MAG: nucleotidyltransferase domain-containing protein [Bacteroidia bacterium]|nr:nucleotidyltransferase domain-containing protein [Bacteroidia bacterium]